MLGLHAFNVGLELYYKDVPFYALIAAAMLKADSENNIKLRSAFPDTYNELKTRYSAPGGRLEGEK